MYQAVGHPSIHFSSRICTGRPCGSLTFLLPFLCMLPCLLDDGKYCLVAGQDRTVRLYNPHRADPDKKGTTKAGELEQALLVKSYAGPHG